MKDLGTMQDLGERIAEVVEDIDENMDETSEWWTIDQELQKQLRRERGFDD